MVLKIGLTGGLATGKSLASSFFNKLGVTVLDADHIAHTLVEPGQPLFESIVQHFGTTYLTPAGALNRSLLRTHIFQDKVAKQWLESLLHPPILKELKKQAQVACSPYVILSIPLLIELHLKSMVDRLLVIDCAPLLQQSRALERDLISLKTFEAIMAQQASRSDRYEAADDILLNNGTPSELENQIQELHLKYMRIVTNNPFLA